MIISIFVSSSFEYFGHGVLLKVAFGKKLFRILIVSEAPLMLL
jgi:hypothetical protein